MELHSGTSSYVEGMGAYPHRITTTPIKYYLLLFPTHKAWVVQMLAQGHPKTDLGL